MNEMQMKYDGDESYDNAATRLRSLFRRYCTTLRDGLQGHFLRNRVRSSTGIQPQKAGSDWVAALCGGELGSGNGRIIWGWAGGENPQNLGGKTPAPVL